MKNVAIVTCLVVASTAPLVANGQQFFLPAGRGKVELVYFGRVKDAVTGKPIAKPPYVSVVDPFTGIFIPFQGDSPGHFRSPDIGAAILEVGSRPIDTSQFEITVSAAGYETVRLAHIPRQSKGAVELIVKMEPKAAPGDAAASAAAQSAATGGTSTAATDSSKPVFFLLAACFGLAAISGVVRTVGRPASTER